MLRVAFVLRSTEVMPVFFDLFPRLVLRLKGIFGLALGEVEGPLFSLALEISRRLAYIRGPSASLSAKLKVPFFQWRALHI